MRNYTYLCVVIHTHYFRGLELYVVFRVEVDGWKKKNLNLE